MYRIYDNTHTYNFQNDSLPGPLRFKKCSSAWHALKTKFLPFYSLKTTMSDAIYVYKSQAIGKSLEYRNFVHYQVSNSARQHSVVKYC